MAPAGARVRPPPERPFWHSIFVFQQYIRRVEAESTMTTTENAEQRADQRAMQSEEHEAKPEAKHDTAPLGCTCGSKADANPICDLMEGLSDLEDDENDLKDCSKPKLVLGNPGCVDADTASRDDKTHAASSGTDAVLDQKNKNSPPPPPGGGAAAASADERWDDCEFSFADVDVEVGDFELSAGAPAGSPAAAAATAPATAPAAASASAPATAKKGRAPVHSGVRLPGKPKQDPATIPISYTDKIKIENFIQYCKQNLHEIEHHSMQKGNQPGRKYTFLEKNTVVHLVRSALEGTLDREIQWKRAHLCSARGRGILYCSCDKLLAMGGGKLNERHRVDSCARQLHQRTEL